MNLTFIANACCIYESNGFKILCDPWLIDGAFYGSWYHYPPLKTKPQDVADYDLLYISHLHPDHFDPKTLKDFDKNKPVIILDDEGPNYLEKLLRFESFKNIVKLKDNESRFFGPFTLTMYKPFVKHPFFDCAIGNTIDSALVVMDDKHTVLNTNDNTPDLKSAERLKGIYKHFDVAQLNYNAAGPYPSCFNNLTNEEKYLEHHRLIQRNLDHMISLCEILAPKILMPFAGQYVLGGKNWEKNEYLGTTDSEEAGRYYYLQTGHRYWAPTEGERLNLSTLESSNRELLLRDSKHYLQNILATKKYDYESEPIPAQPELDCLMQEAMRNVLKAQERFGCLVNCKVVINNRWIIDFAGLAGNKDQVLLNANLDPALLFQILTRKAHWNNAEIGCHIEFDRRPNIYQPDVHFLLCYLHV